MISFRPNLKDEVNIIFFMHHARTKYSVPQEFNVHCLNIEYLRWTMLCYHLLLLLSSYSEVTVVVPDAFPGWMPSQINLKPAWERRGEWGLEHMVLNYPLRIIHLLLVCLLFRYEIMPNSATYSKYNFLSRFIYDSFLEDYFSWQNANNSSNVLWPLHCEYL